MLKNIWTSNTNPCLSTKDFAKIQQRVDACVVPSSIGRIPRKILQTFLHSKREPLKRGTEYGITE